MKMKIASFIKEVKSNAQQTLIKLTKGYRDQLGFNALVVEGLKKAVVLKGEKDWGVEFIVNLQSIANNGNPHEALEENEKDATIYRNGQPVQSVHVKGFTVC